MALNSGVFVHSLTPQGLAKKIPGMCPGMKLLRAKVGDGPEKDVSGHTRATIQHLVRPHRQPPITMRQWDVDMLCGSVDGDEKSSEI